MTDYDDEIPCLPADTLAILQQFREEQQKLACGNDDIVTEDWQLSQFWYTAETARELCLELVDAIGGNGSIACISCPTLLQYFPEISSYDPEKIKVSLLEYDQRFSRKYPTEYITYDYRHPLLIPEELKGTCDIVIADPPFLADECLLKTAQTIRLLAKPNAKIILCTGTVMEERVSRLLGLRRLRFEPSHANNLSNEFSCFVNYETVHLS